MAEWDASQGGRAAGSGILAHSLPILLLLPISLACAPWRAPDFEGEGARSFTLPAPSASERYCAWFGDATGDMLYVGASPFWSALRAAGGDPEADERIQGPELVGRFDLERLAWQEPLQVGSEGPSGVWDVLVQPSGLVWFTTFFGSAGVVDPATGAVRRLDAGRGLNEIAAGPEGSVLVTRYGGGADGAGSVVVIGEDGAVRAEHVLLPGARGEAAAAKSVAFDPVRHEIWVNTDLLPADGGEPGHDARVLDLAGRELLRIGAQALDASGRRTVRLGEPEVQFMAFAANGAAWIAAVQGRRLVLHLRSAGSSAAPLEGRLVELDADFPADLDFVQDIKPAAGPGGETLAVVTRWSGRIHVVDAAGRVRSLALPALAEGGLYYTAVLHAGRVCATHCHEMTVVCQPLPADL